jgi:hypothetical protein
MPLPNQTVENKETIMSMQPNTNLKPVELMPAELDSVAGGNPGAVAALAAAALAAALLARNKAKTAGAKRAAANDELMALGA